MDPTNIYLWISLSVDNKNYFGATKRAVINCALTDLIVVDFDVKTGIWINPYMNACKAYVETEKGYHFIYEYKKDVLYTQQDPKYKEACINNGYWSQLIQNKTNNNRRVMICRNDDWEPFVKKWNYLVNEYITNIEKKASLNIFI